MKFMGMMTKIREKKILKSTKGMKNVAKNKWIHKKKFQKNLKKINICTQQHKHIIIIHIQKTMFMLCFVLFLRFFPL